MFTWITKLGFAGVLSCLALFLSLFFTTGVASAHRVDSLGLTTSTVDPPFPENITLTCLSGPCLPTITVVLESIGVGTSGNLTLNFRVTNKSLDDCLTHFSSSLFLQDEHGAHAYYYPAGPGIGGNTELLPASQSVTISPYFPLAPLKGQFDLQQVLLYVTCPPGGNNTVVMSYQNVLGIGE